LSTTASSTAGASEVDLLRQARAVLASRPREAFAITQSHRQQYPQGVFAQERDALAIEALMRAGEMGTARGLAERFVREHPSSPHTHRFNETILR
jgi:outer membrane protein assembly factor BamD (BamD/ComL family)